MKLEKMINDLFEKAMSDSGSKAEARKTVERILKFALQDYDGVDVGSALREAVEREHDTFVKKKKVAQS